MSKEHRHSREEKEGFTRQSQLIHLLLAYHKDRVKNGFPFALGNLPTDATSLLRKVTSVEKRIVTEGIHPFDLATTVREHAPADVVQKISDGITASFWHSLTQLIDVKNASIEERYKPFVLEVSMQVVEADKHAKSRFGQHYDAYRYMGSPTMHAGLDIGIRNMTFFSTVRYGLREDHAFDPVMASQLFSRTQDSGLSVLNGHQAMMRAMPHSNPLSQYISEKDLYGISKEKLQEHCVPGALGCPASKPMSEETKEILSRHDLIDDTILNKSAIIILAEDVRTYVFAQIDRLLNTLSFEEEERMLSEGSKTLLRGTWKNY